MINVSLCEKVERAWNAHTSRPERGLDAHLSARIGTTLKAPLANVPTATEATERKWQLIDVSTTFEGWLENHEYRDEYLRAPEAYAVRRTR